MVEAPSRERVRRRQTVAVSHLRPGDLLDEAVLGIGSRPARMFLTMIGTVVGIAALMATIGLGQTAAGQVSGRFDAAAATRVVAEPAPAPPGAPGDDDEQADLPWDAAARAARLAGVEAAATVSEVAIGDDGVSGVRLTDPSAAAIDIPVVAASPDLSAADDAELAAGRFFDAGHDLRADPVAVLGRRAAERLGINRVDISPTIFFGGRPYTVIGILDSSGRRDTLLDAVIIPNGTAAARFGLTGPSALDVKTALGAAQQVGSQLAIALSPNDPNLVEVAVPPPPGRLGGDVLSDVGGLILAAGGLALVVGSFGIANVTLLSVMERTGEIGLRRALGARRRHIAGQFLTESGIIGLVGGLIGAALGILVVVGVSITRQWSAVLDLRFALAAPVAGALVGLLAGAYPAAKAAATEPITALRHAD